MLKSYFSYLYSNTAKSSGLALHTLLEHNKNAVMLDCGCWDGANTKKFGNIVGTNAIYGIEFDKAKAKDAAKKGVTVKIADLNKRLPYRGSMFDVIIAYHVIEHLVNVKFFVAEIYRLLKKGGYAIIGTPNLASWHNIFALLLGLQPFSGPTIKPDYESDIGLVKKINKERLNEVFCGDRGIGLEHIKVMTLNALVCLLKDTKFRIEKIRGFGYYPLPPPLATFMQGLDPRHSHYILIKARKGA